MLTPIGNLNNMTIEEILDSTELQGYQAGMATNTPYKECAICKAFTPGNIESYVKYSP